MNIRPLPAERAAVRRYIEALWLPYNRELETVVDDFALADDVDIVAEELDYRLERHDSGDLRTWVAVEEASTEMSLTDVDAEFVGFVTTELEESPTVFDQPDRLYICDIYVTAEYRGTELAHELLDQVRRHAREKDCTELKLDVDDANERAIAFYEKLGFEFTRHTMVTSVS